MSNRKPKRGRLSAKEKEFIRSRKGELTPEEIADYLGRSVELVTEYIRDNVRDSPRKDASIHRDLRSSEAWKILQQEFVPEELKYLEESYVKLVSQFKGQGGVMPAEETQILQAIKYEILMSRNLRERKRAREDIDRLERMQADFLEQFGGDPSAMSEDDKAFALNLETQLSVARSAERNCTNEYVKLQERHDGLMKSLKAVRDQRLKQFENAKTNFLDVIRMLQERDVQAQEGRHMELVRMAADKAMVDLGRPHRYDDGNEDSPILSADTVDLGPEEGEGVREAESGPAEDAA